VAFRSRVFRPLDLRRPANLAILGLAAAAGVTSGVLWLGGADGAVLLAPGHVFVVWALLREIDPDHELPALAAGAVAGTWVLLGRPGVPVLALVGLLMAARLVVGTVGRRPYTTDLVGLAALATAISYTRTGWVAGFGLALAIYIDDRMAEESTTRAVVCAGVGALGASVVATAARAFPTQVPDVDPLVVTGIGLVALACILRLPPTPISLVDSRMKTPIGADRLHAGRSLVGVLVFVAALLAGAEVQTLYPLVAALVLALGSAEVEAARRRG
jgi:hypothetical protein